MTQVEFDKFIKEHSSTSAAVYEENKALFDAAVKAGDIELVKISSSVLDGNIRHPSTTTVYWKLK